MPVLIFFVLISNGSVFVVWLSREFHWEFQNMVKVSVTWSCNVIILLAVEMDVEKARD